MTADPAAAEDAMFASDWAVFADRDAEQIAHWNDGPMPDPWRHAVPLTDQTVIKVDAQSDHDS